jgi:hypothetical protein
MIFGRELRAFNRKQEVPDGLASAARSLRL